MTLPASSVISAERRSHSIWSKGLIFGSLKMRSTRSVLCVVKGALTARLAAGAGLFRRRVREDGAAITWSFESIISMPFQKNLAQLSQIVGLAISTRTMERKNRKNAPVFGVFGGVQPAQIPLI